MKLNLGSNTERHDGFTNVDIRQTDGVDIVDNVMTLNTIESESCEEIIAHNILEHVSPDRVQQTVDLWASKLVKGGGISIGVPDGEFIMKRYIDGLMPWKDVVHDIFGNVGLLREWHGEDAEKYGHHILFSKDYLKEFLVKAGLGNFQDEKPNHGAGFTLHATKL